MRKVITIDGLAATGKSSIAQLLAKKLDFAYFSSGLLYRSLGYAVLSGAADINSEASVLKILNNLNLDITLDPSGKNKAILEGKEITAKLYESRVSEASSIVSVYPSVRKYLLEKQRAVFPGTSLIAEGRDMGTVVFADADIKFFIEADLNARIERRLSQIYKDKALGAAELKSLKQKMEIEIISRDKRDVERSISPTLPAQDAVIINNSRESLTEVVEKMYDFVSKKGLA
jgi:cytidylate kinase